MIRIGRPRTPVLEQQHGVQVCALEQRSMIANPTIDKDALAKGKIHRRRGGEIEWLGGAGSARRLAGLCGSALVYLKSNSSNRSLIAGPLTGT